MKMFSKNLPLETQVKMTKVKLLIRKKFIILNFDVGVMMAVLRLFSPELKLKMLGWVSIKNIKIWNYDDEKKVDFFWCMKLVENYVNQIFKA